MARQPKSIEEGVDIVQEMGAVKTADMIRSNMDEDEVMLQLLLELKKDDVFELLKRTRDRWAAVSILEAIFRAKADHAPTLRGIVADLWVTSKILARCRFVRHERAMAMEELHEARLAIQAIRLYHKLRRKYDSADIIELVEFIGNGDEENAMHRVLSGMDLQLSYALGRWLEKKYRDKLKQKQSNVTKLR